MPPENYIYCGRCNQLKHKSAFSTTVNVIDLVSGQRMCESCHRPLVLRYNLSEGHTLHSLLGVARWLYMHMPRELGENLFACNCEPTYEYDTNATIHQDHCNTYNPGHIEATIMQAAAIIEPVTSTGEIALDDVLELYREW